MAFRETRILALVNQKGGCGKTTTTVSLAAGFVAEGYTVCVVDSDPQCNTTESFGLNRDDLTRAGRYTIADIFLAKKSAADIVVDFGDRFQGRLHLVAGHRGLGSVSHRLDSQLQTSLANEDASDLDADDIKTEHRHRLKTSLDSLRGRCDVVLIDTLPDLGFLLTAALIAADVYVIPVFPSGYDLKGLETLLRTIEKVQKRYNPRLRLLGVLLGNFDVTAKLDGDIQKMLVRKFGVERLFETAISRSVKHREATVYGQTIFEHAPGQQASQQFVALTGEVIRRLDTAGNSSADAGQAGSDEDWLVRPETAKPGVA
jgi:chromosome partitioning protein